MGAAKAVAVIPQGPGLSYSARCIAVSLRPGALFIWGVMPRGSYRPYDLGAFFAVIFGTHEMLRGSQTDEKLGAGSWCPAGIR